jgi:hypothetical protein
MHTIYDIKCKNTNTLQFSFVKIHQTSVESKNVQGYDFEFF